MTAQLADSGDVRFTDLVADRCKEGLRLLIRFEIKGQEWEFARSLNSLNDMDYFVRHFRVAVKRAKRQQ